jgi:hypothetical protein
MCVLGSELVCAEMVDAVGIESTTKRSINNMQASG